MRLCGCGHSACGAPQIAALATQLNPNKLDTCLQDEGEAGPLFPSSHCIVQTCALVKLPRDNYIAALAQFSDARPPGSFVPA
tara:strand:+ start:32970 stop:33215 length:246 start_codon:yes stop_codon:yes gene_type:complete